METTTLFGLSSKGNGHYYTTIQRGDGNDYKSREESYNVDIIHILYVLAHLR